MADTEDDRLERESGAIHRELGVPACPDIVARIAGELRSEDPDLRKLAGLISADVALSAEVFKAVNSAYFGLKVKITSVQQALAVLGLRSAANLVAGLMLRRSFPAGARPAMQRFWERSAELATTAAALAGRLRDVDAAEAHTYALFRDCGAAVMIARFEGYGTLYDALLTQPGRQVTQIEDTRYRYSHARVGYALARGWMLPEPLARAILVHHEFEAIALGRREIDPANARLLACGLLAEQVLSLRAGRGLCPDWRTGEDFTLQTLGIGIGDVLRFSESPASDPA